ncbi:MAG: hypothetical protein ROO76_00970 [Terriglobia bacterium]|nr:hypothetical protein [Terriglobia bacterium]
MADRTNNVILKTQENPDESVIKTAPYLDAPFEVKDHGVGHDLSTLRGQELFHVHDFVDGPPVKFLPHPMADLTESVVICGNQLPSCESGIIRSWRPDHLNEGWQLVLQRDVSGWRICHLVTVAGRFGSQKSSEAKVANGMGILRVCRRGKMSESPSVWSDFRKLKNPLELESQYIRYFRVFTNHLVLPNKVGH